MSKPRSYSIAGAFTAVIGLVLHGWLVLRTYPLELLRNGTVPLKGDIARHFATAFGGSQVGGLYGYDPYFMAGYPVGLW
ncbi:MAG: hypothetical protein O3A51_07205, partial [Verrucomicrobia bacterium]|nr:hypothetical protein [Verrucomicrobiota bacterium]